MAKDSISLEIDSTQVNQDIDALLNNKNTLPLMDDLGRVIKADTLLNFRNQASPDGKSWAPTHRGGQILRDTGRLRNSINYQTVGIDTVFIGTNLVYAATHQLGATIKAKNAPYLKFMIGGSFISKKQVTIPARPFLGLGSRALKKINKAIEAWSADLYD